MRNWSILALPAAPGHAVPAFTCPIPEWVAQQAWRKARACGHKHATRVIEGVPITEMLVLATCECSTSPVRLFLPKSTPMLQHLLYENGINASGLARLLGIHPSMGSKLLKGDRALTVDHIRLLAARSTVRADTFID
ncbi:MAG: hypothetical protein AABZ53_16480 [Planctomycetota bacterium]